MTKRKPERVVVHRIELQTKERELIEQYIYMQQANRLVNTITQIDVGQLYALLNFLELAGIIDTPIPTITSADEILPAIHAWTTTAKTNPETGETETVLLQDRINSFLAQVFDPRNYVRNVD